MNMHVPALQRSLSDVVAEYDAKHAAIGAALATFAAAGSAIEMAGTIGGTYGRTSINTGNVWESTIAESLLKSAWWHVYDGLNIARVASASDKKRFDQEMTKPAPFTLDNIRATFGGYIKNPRGNILRGLAEVFCSLDQSYKSHGKVKIGVAGLPKRVILTSVGGYGSWGRDRLENVLNALASYQGKPLVTPQELQALLEDECALLETRTIIKPRRYGDPDLTPVFARGVRLKRFGNGNGHLIFEPDTLRDINRALAEYYGDVLPDTTDEKPTKRQASTAVAKDLQYYPTPAALAESIVAELYGIKGAKVLEPQCGCGRILDALRKAGAHATGIEVDPRHVATARAKGHRVMLANFLETVPTGDCDHVVMNPPFYGRHYIKHVEHAWKFLKPGGKLTAVLPASARYDHGAFPEGKWSDLPVGSFAESGTNVNTTILTLTANNR